MKILIPAIMLFLLFIAPPSMADECMEGDCEDGVGTGFTEEGKIYQGQWKDGMPHGVGKLSESKGKYIEGIWEMGTLKENILQQGEK